MSHSGAAAWPLASASGAAACASASYTPAPATKAASMAPAAVPAATVAAITVFVTPQSPHKTLTLNDIDPALTVAEVVDRVGTHTGVPAKHLRLVYESRPMELDRTLSDYDVRPDSTLRVVPRMEEHEMAATPRWSDWTKEAAVHAIDARGSTRLLVALDELTPPADDYELGLARSTLTGAVFSELDTKDPTRNKDIAFDQGMLQTLMHRHLLVSDPGSLDHDADQAACVMVMWAWQDIVDRQLEPTHVFSLQSAASPVKWYSVTPTATMISRILDASAGEPGFYALAGHLLCKFAGVGRKPRSVGRTSARHCMQLLELLRRHAVSCGEHHLPPAGMRSPEGLARMSCMCELVEPLVQVIEAAGKNGTWGSYPGETPLFPAKYDHSRAVPAGCAAVFVNAGMPMHHAVQLMAMELLTTLVVCPKCVELAVVSSASAAVAAALRAALSLKGRSLAARHLVCVYCLLASKLWKRMANIVRAATTGDDADLVAGTSAADVVVQAQSAGGLQSLVEIVCSCETALFVAELGHRAVGPVRLTMDAAHEALECLTTCCYGHESVCADIRATPRAVEALSYLARAGHVSLRGAAADLVRSVQPLMATMPTSQIMLRLLPVSVVEEPAAQVVAMCASGAGASSKSGCGSGSDPDCAEAEAGAAGPGAAEGASTTDAAATSATSPSASTDVTMAAFECCVCLCDALPGQQVRALPKCMHVFHAACIERWVLEGHGGSKCPQCRAPISVYDGIN